MNRPCRESVTKVTQKGLASREDHIAIDYPWIAGMGTALPENFYGQDEILEAYSARLSADRERALARRLFPKAGVGSRHLARPILEYAEPHGFGKRNRRYQKDALELMSLAARQALESGGVAPEDVSHVVFATTTGLATPSLDAALARDLGLRPSVQRLPLFGLGCAGGVASLARAFDLARLPGSGAVLVVAAETCSHCFIPGDGTPLGVVASSLFADGAASVVLMPPSRSPGSGLVLNARIVDRGSHLIPESAELMGWTFEDDGFHLVLDRSLPALIEANIAPPIEGFLGAHGLTAESTEHLVFHPGGPRILDALLTGLGLESSRVQASWDVLDRIGNLSSATVLVVLGELLTGTAASPGEHALVLAPGPGFSFEFVLLAFE